MSTYNRRTKHPRTGQWEEATWYDDLFGPHRYGVVFPSEVKRYDPDTPLRSIAFDPERIELETREGESKNGDYLASFTQYCLQHPELRFFQALREWVDAPLILTAKGFDGKNYHGLEDTYYIE